MSASLHSLLFICIFSAPTLFARELPGFRHEAVNSVNKRQVGTGVEEVIPINFTVSLNATISLNATTTPSPTSTVPEDVTPTIECPVTTESPVLSTVFPSPGALPVMITAQSQVVESYIPEMAWCVGGGVGLVPTTTLTGPPYGNGSTLYSMTIGGSGTCETLYIATATTMCATTLTGLASKVAVSECDQEITFSSECGFTMETPSPTTVDNSVITPAPVFRRMVAYYLAPWQSLTIGETPSDVGLKVCTIPDDELLECEHYQEVWEVVVLITTVTTEREVQIVTTMSGPGTLIVETLQAEITDTLVYFSFSTVLHLAMEIETETTSKRQKFTTELPTSTTYLTMPVEYASTEMDTSVAIISTATQYVNGTTTMT